MQSTKNHFNPPTLFLLLALTLLAGCGFHLRGQYDVPDFLKQITLRTTAVSEEFAREMRLALARNNIVPEGGDITLDIVRENLTQQTTTVDSHAQAAEYTLVYTVEYTVGLLGRNTLSPKQTLVLRRNYQYSTANVVGKSTEEETLVRELRIDAAQQIVRRITSMKQPPQPLADDATDGSATPAPATP